MGDNGLPRFRITEGGEENNGGEGGAKMV